MGALLNPATIQLAISLISEAPSLISTLKDDIDAISGGTMTPEELQTKWSAMNVAFAAAKAKWNVA